ncbi:Flp family type IVb pilin [Hyphococcus sp.]|uniref:Flp family type IVb pilin n=1 Tax=Hyphococcus sp. TaxID=2038636 RepID=UPI003CCBA740
MNAKSRLQNARRSAADRVADFWRDENGATAIEYSLIVALIFLTIVAAVRSYTETTSDMYTEIETTIREN